MKNAEELFTQALRLSPDERTDWLQNACGDNHDLHDRVRQLLDAQQQLDSQFLEAPADELQATVLGPVSEASGSEIGPYKLREQLGEGGMGTVFVADQKEPVRRRVALKIIKPGMDSAQVIARFEAERQALAMMDHPGIARVLDAGTTSAGRPYFAMELVKGVPITQYCDDRQLSPRERLVLFIPVCQAVQHAHQKGVVHRDIKPSNILVAEYDDKPVPMIIDFGIAKALNSELTEKTVYTQYGQLIGTLEYMSPEQAKLNQLDIDTRSDVYSLGVVLYELLTGTTPLTKEQLRSVGYDEMLRMIRETDAPRPSTRLTQSKELPVISANRRSAPQKLGAIMKGELDWIVMKALEKDRTRRYASASEFGDDVQRYLNDEPVEACPPSATYRLSKFIRRNRAAAATIGVLCAGVMIAAIGASIGYFRLQHALVVERDSREEVEDSLEKVEVARSEAVVSEQAAVKSERAATEALRRLEESQDLEREANLENALLHANEVTRSIEGLRQQKPLALHTAARVLKELPEKHPAAERLRNQIEWGLLCTPKLVHQMEIPKDARFGYTHGHSPVMYFFRGEDNRAPLTRLFSGAKRIAEDSTLKAFTEIRVLDPKTGRLTSVTLKGRFRRFFPVDDGRHLISVDHAALGKKPEVIRKWDLATGEELQDPIHLDVPGWVVGVLNQGDILLTNNHESGLPTTILAVRANDGTVLAETEIERILNPQVKRLRYSINDNFVITDLGSNSFQIQLLGDGRAFTGVGKLTADSLEIVAFNEATPYATVASSRTIAVASEEDPARPEATDFGGAIRVLDPKTQEQVRPNLPLIHGTGPARLVMSEDSRVLMVGRRTDSTADLTKGSELWDLDQGRLMCRLDMKAGQRQCLSRDGRFVALIETEPAETHVTIHRSENAKPLGVPITLPGKYEAVTFSANSRRLFTVYETPDEEKRHIFQVWQIPGLETSRPFPTSGMFRAMAFNSAGELCICQRSPNANVGHQPGNIAVWNVDELERTRILRCKDAGMFGHNTFGSRPDSAISVALHEDFQMRLRLWHTRDAGSLQQTIVPSTLVVQPRTLRLTPQFVFWKNLGGQTVAYDLKAGQEVAYSKRREWDSTAHPTLCDDDGTVHYRVGPGNLERMEFDGSKFTATDSKTYSEPGVTNDGGPKFVALLGQNILITTDSGLRRIDTNDLTAGSPFLSLGDGVSYILAIDKPRNRIAVHNVDGYFAVIDVASGRPLLQRTIPPKTTWHMACFNPATGDVFVRVRPGGMVYRYAVPDSPELQTNELSALVASHTGLNVKPGRVFKSVEPIADVDESNQGDTDDQLDFNLSQGILHFGRGRSRGAWIYADRLLKQHPDDWLALLIRGHAARVQGEVESLSDDITRAVAIAEKKNEVEQLRPWLQALGYNSFLGVLKLSGEDQIAVTFEYVDVLKNLPNSETTLSILLENCHAVATKEDDLETAAAIEQKAMELGLRGIQFGN